MGKIIRIWIWISDANNPGVLYTRVLSSSLYALFLPNKTKWKSTYDTHLKQQWTTYMTTFAECLQKARFLNAQMYHIGKPYPIIRFAPCHIKDIQKCTVKLQLITGSYILQAQRAKFNQFDVKPDCLLCGAEPETRTHFLVSCASLQEHRSQYLTQIEGILVQSCSNPEIATEICEDPIKCTALILDCTSDSITSKVLLNKNAIAEIEQISQKLIFSLHTARKKHASYPCPRPM